MHQQAKPLTLRQIRLQKLRAENPHLFTVTGYPPMDLSSFQRALLREQRAQRLSGFTQAKAKVARNRWRLRVRRPFLSECKVIDTGTDAQRSRLYFELSNGMIVRADRAADRQEFDSETGRFKKGRRRHPFAPVIRDIVTREVALNANREAA